MKVHDPVCGMQIEQKEAVGNATYEGETYFFCSESCKGRFSENPESFIERGTGDWWDKEDFKRW